MTDASAILISEFYKAIELLLREKGELLEGETVALRVSIIGDDGKQRKSFLLNREGVATFSRTGNVFFDRDLSSEDLEVIRNHQWPNEWQKKTVVARINQGLSAASLPFRLAPVEVKLAKEVRKNSNFRFYRIAEEVQENAAEASSG